jgi:phosphatidylglycerophosphate synthase
VAEVLVQSLEALQSEEQQGQLRQPKEWQKALVDSLAVLLGFVLLGLVLEMGLLLPLVFASVLALARFALALLYWSGSRAKP